jgi:hypothetical protein
MAVPLPRGKQGEKQAQAHNNKTFCFFSSYLCFLNTTWPNVFIVFFLRYQLSVYAVKLFVIVCEILLIQTT